MDPTEALRSIEVALRLGVRQIFGDEWKSARGAPDQEELERRKIEEEKRRDGAVPSSDLLDYTETYHLVGLVEKNWEKFKPIFSDKARTMAFLGVVLDVRNSIAHSRQLTHFERDLLSGIAGQLRNQISIFRGTVDESARFYPRIESVLDNFGRKAQPFYPSAPPISSVRLEVGQVLEFSAHAFGVDGRPVSWILYFGDYHGGLQEDQPTSIIAVGTEVNFEYAVNIDDVGENKYAMIYIVADGRFHRYQRERPPHDDRVALPYHVNPPLV